MSFIFGATGTSNDDYVINFKPFGGGGGVVNAGAGNDIILGYFDPAANTFEFGRDAGYDQIFGYQAGIDDLDFSKFSRREVTVDNGETANGHKYVDVKAGGLAATSENHIEVRIWGVEHADLDFIFG